MAKLKPDYINWVLNLNAKQVHTEIAAQMVTPLSAT